MATFSPSPAPRRSFRQQSRAASPQRSQRHKRHQTSLQLLNDDSSIASAMDVDDRSSVVTDFSLSKTGGDVLFAKTDEMSVSFYANLPLEVKQVLRISDFGKDPYSGEIDIETGFALVTSVQTCFVWQHAQAIKGIPTCYVFSCPYESRFTTTPFHSLVPQGSAREPGLILVSPAGQVRFWDSIGMGLAGGDNFVQAQLEDIEYDEEVTNLVRLNPQNYVVSTSYGGLYRLVLTSVGGKYHVAIRPFSRPPSTGSFSRFIPFLSSSSSSYELKDKNRRIHAISLGRQSNTDAQELFSLANGHIQHWMLNPEGWEDLVSDVDPTTVIAKSLLETSKGRVLQVEHHDLELSDLAVFDNGNIAVLVSYPEMVDENNSGDFRRSYALAELEVREGFYRVKHLHGVPYQTTSKPGLPVHPRIQLIYGGSIISVQFGEAVALCARGSEFSDRLELKSVKDRTLGVGVSPSTNLLLILTASTMMKVFLDLEKIQSFKPETGHTKLVKSIMIQAILYGSSPINPLRFSFPPSLNAEALMEAAQQLSSAVLESKSEVVRQIPDMTAQMAGRKERLSWLIAFINENAVLLKMSQSSRQKLAIDAEKLYACHQLWLSYNQFLASSPSQSVLKDAITDYMAEIGDDTHEDLVRAFFRSRVADIGKVLRKVSQIVERAPSTGSNIKTLLPEANRIIMTVLRSAFDYRTFNLKVYGIQLPMKEAWSSRRSVIDTVILLFNRSREVIESTPGFPDRIKDKEPSSQLPALAGVLLESMHERLHWLSSVKEEHQTEWETFQQQSSVLQPEVLEALRKCGHEDAAFKKAEDYHDYSSLVALCHRQNVYPPEKNPHAERLRSYVQRFKESFTEELFQWYIQHGEVRTMFDQECPGSAYLDTFFRERHVDSISWINDIGKSRFGSAASTLLQDAVQAANLEAKHLMLSIGKLSMLAQTQETNVPDDAALDDFHEELDVISVHEGLLQEFRTVMTNVRTRQPVDGQVDTIYAAKGSHLAGRSAFTHIFKDLLRQLLQGKALSIEDLVELLTLKDNTHTVEDFATGLQLLSFRKDLPEARLVAAVRTVWRRVYLHDDWDAIQQTSGVSDDELNQRYHSTALYATLCSVLQRNQELKSPAEALMIPSREVIVSRWPGMSMEQIESLISDYTFEQDRLGDWVLDGIFDRIRELAEADLAEKES